MTSLFICVHFHLKSTVRSRATLLYVLSVVFYCVTWLRLTSVPDFSFSYRRTWFFCMCFRSHGHTTSTTVTIYSIFQKHSFVLSTRWRHWKIFLSSCHVLPELPRMQSAVCFLEVKRHKYGLISPACSQSKSSLSSLVRISLLIVSY